MGMVAAHRLTHRAPLPSEVRPRQGTGTPSGGASLPASSGTECFRASQAGTPSLRPLPRCSPRVFMNGTFPTWQVPAAGAHLCCAGSACVVQHRSKPAEDGRGSQQARAGRPRPTPSGQRGRRRRRRRRGAASGRTPRPAGGGHGWREKPSLLPCLLPLCCGRVPFVMRRRDCDAGGGSA